MNSFSLPPSDAVFRYVLDVKRVSMYAAAMESDFVLTAIAMDPVKNAGRSCMVYLDAYLAGKEHKTMKDYPLPTFRNALYAKLGEMNWIWLLTKLKRRWPPQLQASVQSTVYLCPHLKTDHMKDHVAFCFTEMPENRGGL